VEHDSKILLDQDTQDIVKTPKMYAVILLNDDVTTMDFVVDLLIKVFHKSTVEASAVMMQVHENGQGIAGVYTYDIAVTKKIQSDRMASEQGFPLKLTIVPDDN